MFAILKGRCPRCREGTIFKSWIGVHEKCRTCGLIFNRETGYFLGAMYMEYAIAGVFIGTVTTLLRKYWPLGIEAAALIGLAICVPFIPLTVRLSRTLWIYWDNAVDPQK